MAPRVSAPNLAARNQNENELCQQQKKTWQDQPEPDRRWPCLCEICAPVIEHQSSSAEKKCATHPSPESRRDLALPPVLFAANLKDRLAYKTLVIVDAQSKSRLCRGALARVGLSLLEGAEDQTGWPLRGESLRLSRRMHGVLPGKHPLVPA